LIEKIENIQSLVYEICGFGSNKLVNVEYQAWQNENKLKQIYYMSEANTPEIRGESRGDYYDIKTAIV